MTVFPKSIRGSKTPGMPTVGTNAVLWNEKRNVLLTKRADVGLWCLPGGMVEIGETVSQTIVRELREEIKCTVAVERLIGVYSEPNVRLTPPAKYFLIVVCVQVRLLHGEPDIGDEVLDVGYFPIDNLPPMVPNQSLRIQHAADDGRPAVVM